MTTYYVDPDATGTDTGASQANAWTSLQRAIDGTDGTQPTAGDTVLLKHGTGSDESLTVTIDSDGLPGSLTTGYVKYIGVNSSWSNDGTKYVIDANSTATCCMSGADVADYIWFENIVFKNATSHGVYYGVSSALSNIFVNCEAISNGGRGFDGYRNYTGFYIKCLAANNTTDGFFGYTSDTYLFSVSRDNGSNGFYIPYNGINIYGSLAFDNGSSGIYSDPSGIIINNVVDNNGYSGIYLLDHRCVVIGNRITNHSGVGDEGLDANSKFGIYGWNYFQNNTTNELDVSMMQEILESGVGTNDEDNGDTNQGYVSLTEGAEDYNLRSDASLRRTAIQLNTG